MHLNPYMIIGSAVVGLLVGVTGARRGALMTPMPILIFGVTPSSALSIDLVVSGSLITVLLLSVYPLIGANQLVVTDLTQPVPLTAAAALGAVTFGHVVFAVPASVAIGSVPAVLVGSFLSSRAPDRYIRPVITYVIFASGLKYVGVPTTPLGITLAAVAVGGLSFWLVRAQPLPP